MSEKNFALTPSVSISRSKFLRTNNHKTSFNLGDIVPLYVDSDVLPGDTRSFDVASLIRMSTPIAPIMDDIEMEIFAFFVPHRLVWDDWKQFIGESPTAGYAAWNGTFPYRTYNGPSVDALAIGQYMGLPYYSTTGSIRVSALPLRAYLAIYNRWFRDQNVEAPCYIDTTDGLDSSTDSAGNAFSWAHHCLVAYKKSDYFTRALPYAQKGAPVTLPLGTTAPIVAVGTSHSLGLPLQFGTSGPTTGALGLNGNVAKLYQYSGSDMTSPENIISTNMVADLGNATAATINQLRETFQIQKLLEKDALYGTRYWELLYGHFGVRSPDATLQDPEYLGGMKFMINVDQVLSTAGYSNTPSTTVGAPGGNSVTGHKGSLFTKSFCEHGTLMILGVARQRRHTYSQGVDRMWTRFDRFDYYWPEFANLGAQEIKNKEIFADGSTNDDLPFGYQECWADLRFKNSIVSGILNPNRSSSLNYWTLADRLASLPTLGQTFLKETRDNLKDALVSGSSGPDFIADFYFQDTAVRPLPLYSIPGLIDHH